MQTELLTVPQAAERLNLAVSTVWKLVGDGTLRSLRVGRARRVPEAALDEFVATQLAVEEQRQGVSR